MLSESVRYASLNISGSFIWENQNINKDQNIRYITGNKEINPIQKDRKPRSGGKERVKKMKREL